MKMYKNRILIFNEMSILDLPFELLEAIYSHLPYHEQLVLSRTSRILHEAFQYARLNWAKAVHEDYVNFLSRRLKKRKTNIYNSLNYKNHLIPYLQRLEGNYKEDDYRIIFCKMKISMIDVQIQLLGDDFWPLCRSIRSYERMKRIEPLELEGLPLILVRLLTTMSYKFKLVKQSKPLYRHLFLEYRQTSLILQARSRNMKRHILSKREEKWLNHIPDLFWELR